MRFLGRTEETKGSLRLLYGILGAVIILLGWVLVTSGSDPIVTSGILPSPWKVVNSFVDLFNDNEIFRNVGLSIGLNIGGYVEAILLAIPLGFIIGLMKFPRWGFQRQVGAFRYIPLTAVIGLFIVWFGIGTIMKIHFLAFGILIYLLPIIVQRIDEVGDVYLKTVHTLGATDWQALKTVYLPSVLSRLSDDIRVLTAISWTYIIVAEGIATQGGIGNLIWSAGLRQGRIDKVFALLIIIMIIGIVQDKIFVWLDREFFPFKYQARDSVKSSTIQSSSFVNVAFNYALMVMGWVALGIYFILILCECFSFFGGVKPLSYLFGSTAWLINTLVIFLLIYKCLKWYRDRNDLILLKTAGAKTSRV